MRGSLIRVWKLSRRLRGAGSQSTATSRRFAAAGRFPQAAIALACVIVAVGCQSTSAPRPVQSSATATVADAPAVDVAAILSQPELRLEDLLALVHVHPRVVAAREQVRAAAGEARQRELRPNPSVGMEIEDLVLDDMDPGRSTTWVGYSQPLVVGDRLRTARMLGHEEVAGRDQAVTVLVHELQSQVRLAWLEMAYLDRRRELLGELTAEVATVRELLQARINGGAAAATEMTRVNLIVASLQEEERQAARRLRTLRLRIPHWLGRDDLAADAYRPTLDPDPALPTVADTAGHPALQQARQAVATAGERLAHERALAVPDVDVGVSVGRSHEADENLVALSVSVPWTVFDRRQGAIQAAEAELAAAEATAEAIATELRVALAALAAEIDGHHAALAAHDTRILPAAEADYTQTVARFRAGKSGILDMLDALRGHADARLQRLELVHELHRSITHLTNMTTYPHSSTASTGDHRP